MKTGKNLLVTLRVFRGKIHHDSNGNVTSENQPMRIDHGTSEWNSVMNSGRYHFSKMIVEKVEEVTETYTDTDKKDKKGDIIRQKHTTYKEVPATDKMKEEVRIATAPKGKPLTKEQVQIADMQKQIDSLTTQDRGKTHKVVAKVPEPSEDIAPEPEAEQDDSDAGKDDIKALRVEYKKLNPLGKGAFTGWGVGVLKEKIAAFKAV